LADIKPIPNDPVAGLIEIPLPREVSRWPETWASRITAIMLLAMAIIALWQLLRYRRANRYRREALAELRRMERGGTAPAELLTQLALLLRRTALAAFPREQVAPLAGSAWLSFLDRTSRSRQFSEGEGRLLASAPYRQAPLRDGELGSLVLLVRQWIEGHHV
jgi:Ca-activated chloride channel family protein